MITQLAGYLSGIVSIISFIPYIRDIFLRKTKPERMSWLIWALLGLILFFSQLAKGGHYSLIVVGVQAVGDFFIFLLAIKYGIGGFLKRDFFALSGAVLGLILWYITKEAAMALFVVIFIDATATVLTVIKSYENPATENMTLWIFNFFSGFFACIAVGALNPTLLAFPIYICLGSASIILAIKLGFRRLKIKNI